MLVLNDLVGYKNRKIYQDGETFSFCLDSILLANFTNINYNDKKILDLGCGNGVIPLILSLKTKALIVGVEIQKRLADMAIDSIKYNHLENQIKIMNIDMKKLIDFYDINSFDVITCNPPYFKCNELSKKNLSVAKMNARHEVSINLSDIISISKKLLKNKGKINLIHRCDRLVEVINLLKINGIEPKKIQFIYNNQNSSAKLFLIQGIKNGREGLIVSDPIILYNNDGTMNDKYKLILEEVQ